VAHPSQTIRNPVQEKEVHNKIKYVTKDPIITLTEDDTELVTNKVQDRGRKWSALQRNNEKRPWKSSCNSMIISNNYGVKQDHMPQCNNRKRHSDPLCINKERRQCSW
jgi:hypothetical protein